GSLCASNCRASEPGSCLPDRCLSDSTDCYPGGTHNRHPESRHERERSIESTWSGAPVVASLAPAALSDHPESRPQAQDDKKGPPRGGNLLSRILSRLHFPPGPSGLTVCQTRPILFLVRRDCNPVMLRFTQ